MYGILFNRSCSVSNRFAGLAGQVPRLSMSSADSNPAAFVMSLFGSFSNLPRAQHLDYSVYF